MAYVPEPTNDSPTRGALLAALRAQPGATVTDLARAARIVHTTATYHLRWLEKRGLVASIRQGNRLHFFVNGDASRADRALTLGRRLPRSEEVLARLPRDAGVPLGAICEGLTMTRPGVLWHLARLAELGLAVAEGPRGARRYRRASA